MPAAADSALGTGKTVFITGCSAGGIGDALAREFQARGHVVFASARSLDSMSELAALAGVHTLAVDVTSDESVAAAAAAVAEATGGRLDVLVNNAGVNVNAAIRRLLRRRLPPRNRHQPHGRLHRHARLPAAAGGGPRAGGQRRLHLPRHHARVPVRLHRL